MAQRWFKFLLYDRRAAREVRQDPVLGVVDEGEAFCLRFPFLNLTANFEVLDAFSSRRVRCTAQIWRVKPPILPIDLLGFHVEQVGPL